jgi:hypothetical protein
MNKAIVVIVVLLLTGCATLDNVQQKCLDHPLVCSILAAACLGAIGAAVSSSHSHHHNYYREDCIFNGAEGTYCP